MSEKSLNYGGSFVNSPDQIKNKYETINPKNDNDKYFLYAGTAALSHKNIVKEYKRSTLLQIIINGKKISFPQHKKDQKKCESNNYSTALNVSFAKNDNKGVE